ncbi:MAG: hypothetical protein HWQ38_09765 [Nostoc sp. NMS7]|uniref:hypothetical protein n=1 Tax=Nostoc sp. NMS7 TaxID=2815391 RepID=UPI0025FD9EC6|nr:hypothetical protein [Nostoc sp. NMS7]MBN3946756.1 hypothetical protein [Nostoc sp. NMS7]
MIKYWTALYLCSFSSAIALGRLCLLLDAHWFLVVVLTGVGIFFWCWWNANFGNLPPISDAETITKFAVIPTVILGWIIGRMYAIG